MLLAGDIGGTKTKLAIFSSQNELKAPIYEETFPSIYYTSLEALVREFLNHISYPIEQASFGVAGPVAKGKAKITNLSWVMDEQELQEALNIPSVYLLNDLDAMAHAVPHLKQEDLYTLNTGVAQEQSPLAVIAPGTGLGEAFLTWNGTHYQTHATEGGHTDFAPTNKLEMEMLEYLLRRFTHVSYENVCSGIGLPNIYAFFKTMAKYEEPDWLSTQLAAAADPTPVIVTAALNKEAAPKICIETVKTFVSILGAEAGNLALKVLATGGVYIGGGIPPRILSFLEDPAFLKAFCNKGRFSGLLTNIPIHVITNTQVALLGAAYHGFDKLNGTD